MFSKVAQIDRQPNGSKERCRLREKSYDFAARPDQGNIEGEQHEKNAVQRDERRAWLRRACSRLRRAAKFSISSESVAASGCAGDSIDGTSEGASNTTGISEVGGAGSSCMAAASCSLASGGRSGASLLAFVGQAE
ncbi:MAG: hypothetical protein WB839_18790 [Pseudolabrys sp.]